MTLLTIMLLTMFTGVSADKYWGDFSDSEKELFLQSQNFPQNVINLYYNKLDLCDDDSTIELLDYLIAKETDVKTKAFKFYLFNKIVISADGSLLEILPKYILQMVLSDIPYVFDYFKINSNVRDTYGLLLGTEFYFKECDSSLLPCTFSQFKGKITSVLGSHDYDKEVFAFFDKIQKQIDSMD